MESDRGAFASLGVPFSTFLTERGSRGPGGPRNDRSGALRPTCFEAESGSKFLCMTYTANMLSRAHS